MHLRNEEKTTFITEERMYGYTRMPFGLKKAGATYQRLVKKMLNTKLGKTWNFMLMT